MRRAFLEVVQEDAGEHAAEVLRRTQNLSNRDTEGGSGEDEEARGRNDDDGPGRSQDRKRSLERNVGEGESESQRDGRESWICKWRRDAENLVKDICR